MTEEQELQQRTASPRLFQLDALRGLAAATVVLHHFRYALDMDSPRWAVALVTSGPQAVVLFFVLSGYVLSLPNWNGKRSPYGAYLIRRICRIYLPFAAAAVLSILASLYFFGSRLPLTPWFYLTWQTHVTPKLLLAQSLMWPMPDFNTAFWSLRYEMQMSILLPIFLVVMRRWNALLFTILLGVAIYAVPLPVIGLPWHFLGLTIEIAFVFVLGVALARYRHPLKAFCERLGPWLWPILACSAFLYYDFPLRILRGPLFHFFDARHYLMTAAGSAGIVLCSLHLPPLSRLLATPLLEYLGRISYSLYLVHSIVLFAGYDLFYGHMRLVALAAIVVPISFLAAHVFCITVEEPCMRLGKWLTRPRSSPPSIAAMAPSARRL